jgi:hypothetical protein
LELVSVTPSLLVSGFVAGLTGEVPESSEVLALD